MSLVLTREEYDARMTKYSNKIEELAMKFCRADSWGLPAPTEDIDTIMLFYDALLHRDRIGVSSGVVTEVSELAIPLSNFIAMLDYLETSLCCG